ncbi:MAG TPA: methyltransferase domain-containing protein [Pseudolabrys sp.]|jgi:ubiquinone/menaquinone biosynthesis C-methylase UbiE|nr:methyltransferase domain-containing protein [Pseudolabrys sp.]
MTDPPIRFDDGAAYERMMGVWSQLAGQQFLDWLAPSAGQRWIDVGCGNGAFTELIVQRCAPDCVDGVDPAEGQLAFARARPACRPARFKQGDAMALPHADKSFDVAVMALVIFFVPDPTKAVAEMVRVVRSGGSVAAYAWDMRGGGFPWEPVQAELRALGQKIVYPPSVDASRIDAMRELWTDAGMTDVETRAITVQRTFDGIDDFLSLGLTTPSIGPIVRAMQSSDVDTLKARLRKRLPVDANGRVTYSARANAVKGQVRK